MRSDRQTGGGNRLAPTVRSLLTGHVLGLAILATVLALAPPAQAAQPPEVADVAQRRHTALVADDRPLRPLPFAQRDLAVMVLGGAVLTVAAAGAPLLFRPLRPTAPARFRLRGASAPPLASGEHAAPTHVPA